VSNGYGNACCHPLHYILHDILYHAPWLHAEISPLILDWLRANEMPNADGLRYCLNILTSGGTPPETLAELAADMACKTSFGSQRPRWFSLWVDTDPGTAIPALEAALGALSPIDASLASQAEKRSEAELGHRAHSRNQRRYCPLERAESVRYAPVPFLAATVRSQLFNCFMFMQIMDPSSSLESVKSGKCESSPGTPRSLGFHSSTTLTRTIVPSFKHPPPRQLSVLKSAGKQLLRPFLGVMRRVESRVSFVFVKGKQIIVGRPCLRLQRRDDPLVCFRNREVSSTD
jgi:hypothetical protein